jgi:hypothetical protein
LGHCLLLIFSEPFVVEAAELEAFAVDKYVLGQNGLEEVVKEKRE